MSTASSLRSLLSCGMLILLATAPFTSSARSGAEAGVGADPDYAGEVLASAPFRDGSGRMEIRRVVEDGVEGVALVRSGHVPSPLRSSAVYAGKPFPEQVANVYWDLTGQRITPQAVQLMQQVEARRARGANNLSIAEAQNHAEGMPRGGCYDTSSNSDVFLYDCKMYGPVSFERSGTDDVCLLTAAIKGNHSMQVSYKSINGNFYSNYSTDVMQGHYRAVQVRTGVKRTRRGQIYNASASDYSRYAFDGDFRLVDLNTYGVTDCQVAAN